jgi:hypothetical protein
VARQVALRGSCELIFVEAVFPAVRVRTVLSTSLAERGILEAAVWSGALARRSRTTESTTLGGLNVSIPRLSANQRRVTDNQPASPSSRPYARLQPWTCVFLSEEVG